MSAITDFTCELSDRLLQMCRVETAPVAMVYSCGKDATRFILAANNQPNAVFMDIVGPGYVRLERADIKRLEGPILNQVQPFAASVVLRKLNRDETTGCIAREITSDEKSSLVQNLSLMLNSAIGEDGYIATHEGKIGTSAIVLLTACPSDHSEFLDRLIKKFKDFYKAFSFFEISPLNDRRFSYFGIYGVQER